MAVDEVACDVELLSIQFPVRICVSKNPHVLQHWDRKTREGELALWRGELASAGAVGTGEHLAVIGNVLMRRCPHGAERGLGNEVGRLGKNPFLPSTTSETLIFILREDFLGSHQQS